MRKIPNEELGRPSISEFKKIKKLPVAVVLDNIRSANNTGSVFRTSDAFLINKIFLCGITAQPPHRDIQKTALGATESVEWEYFKSTPDAIGYLQKQNVIVLAVEQAEGAIILDKFRPEKDVQYAFVFGHEVKGVSREVMKMVDGAIEIPQGGTKHSLNIAVSAGAVLWEIFRKYQINKT